MKLSANISSLFRRYCRHQLRFSSSLTGRETVKHVNSFAQRSHTCGELRKSHAGQKVKLCGWVQFRRLDKFLVLRDAYGTTQLVAPAEKGEIVEKLSNTNLETVISVVGTVAQRPAGQENTKLLTGEVEVVIEDLEILSNPSVVLPFNIVESTKVKDALRMQFRYLDFRHCYLQRNLRLRSSTVMKIRQFLSGEHGFVDIETPTLFRRTPGGAQEFVVPTRTASKFYSLVQSPQQFKQLLMIGGFDRYFQIARCYRDEGTKPNRQPEFTQVDIEMSFTSKQHIQRLIEDMLVYSWPEHLARPCIPFREMTYAEAMSKYGVDKPDTRFDCLLNDFTDLVRDSEMSAMFPKCDDDDWVAVGVVFPKAANLVKKSLDEALAAAAKDAHVSFASVRIDEQLQWRSSLARKLSSQLKDRISTKLRATDNDHVWLAMGHKDDVLPLMGRVRLETADHLQSQGIGVRCDDFHWLWVVDFPLFLPKEGGGFESAHHPFTAPHPEDVDLLSCSPLKVRGLHYDLVLNGSEVGGGSIRIHQASVQKYILHDILNEDTSQLQHLLHALQCGCPPHGGIALGLDRLLSIMCGSKSIRDVIAFPKGFAGQDLMSGAPADISDEEKRMYHLVPRV